MPHGEWHVADVAGAEVEGARLPGSTENAHARLALDVILPLVGVRMPMHLAHCAGIDLDQGRCNLSGYREHAGISDPRRSAASLDRLLGHHSMAEGLRYGGCAGDLVAAKRSRNRRRENVALA